jgi:rsbT antagonist protein RsbS
MARLRGAVTVIVGIRPEVAFAMVQLGMGTGSVATALDLQEGLVFLNSRIGLTEADVGPAGLHPWARAHIRE